MMRAIFETAFDVAYLVSVITIGILMVKKAKGEKQYLLFGLMAIVLGSGDAFHLVPRAIALCTTGLDNYRVPLGTGKLITSITMTFFYVLLYYVWCLRYKNERKCITITVWVLAVLRIVLCLMPQNNWTGEKAPLSWGIIRNVPFSLLGLLIIYLFYVEAKRNNDNDFKHLYLTVVLSFGFYIPVVLLADKYPSVGMLMIPKTLAYVWTVLIGYNAQKRSEK